MRSGLLCALCVCLFLAPPAAWGQPASQIKDINVTVPGTTPLTGDWAEAGGVAYFFAADGIHGSELWRSDGTADGTRLVRDLCPGICSPALSGLTALGDRVVFRREYFGGSIHELWTSDGTAEGTVPFLNGRVYDPLISAGPFVFFTRVDPADTGYELWKTDGTAAGTVLVKDITPGPGGSDVRLLGAIGSTVYFTAFEESTGIELWKSDGTEAGTVLVAETLPGIASHRFESAAVSGSRIFLTTDAAGGSVELWVSDGTAAGTLLLEQGLGSVSHRIGFDGGLVFTTESGSGTTLWASDGTVDGTFPVKELGFCFCPSDRREYRAAGSHVFFSFQGDGNGFELWKTDGTEAGTVPVADINPGAAGSLDPWGSAFTALGGDLLFFADDGTHGFEVWTSDGTAAGTTLVADLEPGAGGSSGNPVLNGLPRAQTGIVAAGKWLFLARTTSDGWALWKTDGTAAGTERVLPIHNQASSIAIQGYGNETGSFGGGLGGLLLFQADDGLTGFELWKSDGTEAGTSLLADVNASSSSYPRRFTEVGDKAYFLASFPVFDPLFGTLQRPQLWKSDGTEAGTEEVLTGGSFPDHLTPLKDNLFFSLSRGLDGVHLHRTVDGPTGFTGPVGSWGPGSLRANPKELTVFGSSLVFSGLANVLWKVDSPWTDPVLFDIHPTGIYLADANRLTVVGSTLFFVADDGATGFELWKTDGTAGGTAQVLDILPGPSSAIASSYSTAAAGGLFFFVADGPDSGRQLWRSDGTAAGTFPLTNVVLGYHFPTFSELTAAFDRVYFVADDGVHGQELWTSDGTVSGTRMVEDINPGPGSSSPQELKYLRHTLLFAADDGTHGLEPWVSDGTAATTFLLQDVAPEALPSSPGDFAAAGPRLYFGANDGTHGFEPWALPKTAVGSTFADVTRAHWAWSQVEAIAAAGITLGCAPERYCAGGTVTRPEMAVFLGRALHGGSFVPPPATGTRFEDVPASHWAGAWIEQIAADGVTQGCSANPPLFCVGSQVTRAEMAIFLLRAKHGGSYAPPPATGTVFTDVPANHWAGAWIEQLAAEGITNGCAAGRYCPGSVVGRAEMAVFLTRTFGLTVP